MYMYIYIGGFVGTNYALQLSKLWITFNDCINFAQLSSRQESHTEYLIIFYCAMHIWIPYPPHPEA